MSDDVRTSVRLPKKLHLKVVEIANEERRSFNNLIIVMAEEYIEKHYARSMKIAVKDADTVTPDTDA
jgi:predicted DNA-binding ribbon-helix-helix protein